MSDVDIKVSIGVKGDDQPKEKRGGIRWGAVSMGFFIAFLVALAFGFYVASVVMVVLSVVFLFVKIWSEMNIPDDGSSHIGTPWHYGGC